MEIQILKTHQDVQQYIHRVRKCADLHRTELGFLVAAAYEEQSLQGKLWVCIDKVQRTYLGHLMFGGKYPYLKVFQLVVLPEYRKEMIPFHLFAELEEYGLKNSFLNITARVAEELPANVFWDFVGLKLIRQVEGGKARGRIINLRSKELETTSLLSLIERSQKHDSRLITYSQDPVLSSNLYIIDVNILLDIVRDRTHKKEASAIIRAGLNNYIRIAVTEEFVNELRRTNKGRESDPLLELAKELPIIRAEKTAIEGLLPQLREIVFPERGKSRSNATQDKSDLIHIATCILSKASGFVTREKAILRAKDNLFSKYNIEILSPIDIDEPDESITHIHIGNFLNQGNYLKIDTLSDGDSPSVRLFLSGLKLNPDEIDTILKKGATGALRQRIIFRYNDAIIGTATWDVPSSVTKEINIYLLIAEGNPAAEKAIDHALESITRLNILEARRLCLHACADQMRTKSTAILRGFRSVKVINNSVMISMTKISFSGYIAEGKWPSFARKFKALTKLALPEKMPSCTSIDDSCINILNNYDNRDVSISFFELETLVSPAILLPKEREGMLLPIQPRYAVELGIYEPNQISLLSSQEAYLHIEKAYFRKNLNTKIYKKGTVLLFYVSGKSEYSQSVVGSARITYSAPNSIDVIANKFSRQGVLPQSELEKLADRNSLIHVITFDSFYRFKHTVPLHFLKKNGYISKANLVTGERQSHLKTLSILEYGFNHKE